MLMWKIAVIFVLSYIIAFSVACKKTADNPEEKPPTIDTNAIKPPVDPPIAATIGFFMDDWQPKPFVVPSFLYSDPVITVSNTVNVDASEIITKIPTAIFGHNANNWMTKMYNEPLFLNHLIKLRPSILRFPAGSGSDVFFWNCNLNQPPVDAPSRLLRAEGYYITENLYTYGKSANSWQATVDNYYSVLKSTNSIGVITVNYGYARYGTGINPVAAAAHLAADWVRYDNGRTKYWEIGNENYGSWELGYRIDVSANKDGQPEYISGKLYAQHFKVFADSMRKAATETGKTIYIGAVMYESPSEPWNTNVIKNWNSLLIPELINTPDFYIGHNYITPYAERSDATTIIDSALSVPGHMMEFMKNEITQYGGTIKPVVLSEWNMWAQDSMQQVSHVSGLFAIIVQTEAIKNKFGLTARWDLYNAWNEGNDHGLFSAGDEPDVPKWTPRPSFYYLYYFQKCIGDRLVKSTVTGNPKIISYASTYTSGQANVVLINYSNIRQTVEVKFKNLKIGNRYYWYVLEGGNNQGNFSRKVFVNGNGPSGIAGGPENYANIVAKMANTSGGIKVAVPAWGAVIMLIDKNY